MRIRDSWLVGAGVGAVVMYVLDPDRGARRRARVRDFTAHMARVTQRGLGKVGRDSSHRLQGTVASLRGVRGRSRVEDPVLIGRVRAALGRLVSHPRAIQVAASEGVVILAGPILEREAKPLLQAIARIRGVRRIVDQLERHEQSAGVPALQGGRAPVGDRLDIRQERWAPATRTVAGASGAALAAAGLWRGGIAGIAAAVAGAALVGRATANVPLHRLIGFTQGRRAVDLQKTITIDAPVPRVYGFWWAFENFPRFMSRVLDVRSSPREPHRSHWKVAGPAGIPVEFDAEITRAIPNQLIAWRTVPGSPAAHGGVVRFEPVDGDRTRVQVKMSYTPRGGWLGHGVASILGADPKRGMDEDLVRMKTIVETGTRRAAPPARREIPIRCGRSS